MDLDLRICKLEEKVKLLETKDYFKLQITEHKRILASEYSNHLNNLRKEFQAYSPKTQANLNKVLLSQLPDKPMKMGLYMGLLKEFVNKHSMGSFNLAEYEIMLGKLGLVKKGLVCKGYIKADILALVLCVL